MGLGFINLSKENWDKRGHEKIEDVGHEADRDDTAKESFINIFSVYGQADWLSKLVEAFEPVNKAMPGFVFLVLNLGRPGPFNISFILLHWVSYEIINFKPNCLAANKVTTSTY